MNKVTNETLQRAIGVEEERNKLDEEFRHVLKSWIQLQIKLGKMDELDLGREFSYEGVLDNEIVYRDYGTAYSSYHYDDDIYQPMYVHIPAEFSTDPEGYALRLTKAYRANLQDKIIQRKKQLSYRLKK